MGNELGQTREWNHDTSLDWHLLHEGPYHAGLQRLVRDLNRVYADTPALFARDHDPDGFEWIDADDSTGSTLSFVRRAEAPDEVALWVFNFTAEVRHELQVGVEQAGYWHELVNTDAKPYGGSGQGNRGGVHAQPVPSHGRPFSLSLTLPPLAALLLSRG
jgi:1,4-alpha-glucan branching enzyme